MRASTVALVAGGVVAIGVAVVALHNPTRYRLLAALGLDGDGDDAQYQRELAQFATHALKGHVDAARVRDSTAGYRLLLVTIALYMHWTCYTVVLMHRLCVAIQRKLCVFVMRVRRDLCQSSVFASLRCVISGDATAASCSSTARY